MNMFSNDLFGSGGLWQLAGLVFGYLMGSVPYGLIFTRLAGLGDIRQIGSGNFGATNVLRTGSRPLALATLLADALKGTLAILIMKTISADAALMAGLGAFLGHLYPVWLKFKGGKGVATYIGVLLGLAWPAALVFCGVWLAIAVLFRISSLAGLTAAAVIPVLVAGGWIGIQSQWPIFAILTVLVFIRHKANIQRLLAGTEPRIGAKKSA